MDVMRVRAYYAYVQVRDSEECSACGRVARVRTYACLGKKWIRAPGENGSVSA